ncbi:MAG TPA: MFS transporter [Herbaspirillum sp.]
MSSQALPLSEVSPQATGLVSGTGQYRRANWALFCAGFSTFSLLYCAQPLLPIFSTYFGVSPAHSSFSVSLTTGLLALSILIVGANAQRLPRKGLMGLSLLVSAVLTVLASTMPDWSHLLLLRALLGIALGGVPAVAMAYLAEEVHPDSLGLAMGLYVGGNAFGGMGGRVITGLIADFTSWRVAMAAIGVIGLIAAGLFMVLLPKSVRFVPHKTANLRSVSKGLTGHLTHGALLGLFAIAFLLMGGFVTIYNYAGYRLQAPPYNMSQALVGAIFTVYLVGIVASAWFGRLADRHGRIKMLTIGIALMLAGTLITLAHAVVWIVIGIAVLTFGFFAAHAVASGTVGQLARGNKAQAASLYLLAYYLGSSVLGSAGGSIFSYAGWGGVTAMVCAAQLIGLLICYRLAAAVPAPARGR